MDRIPVQISFDEIYNLWKEFAQNCTPENNWQEWYNTFEDVDGLMRKDMSEYKSQIINSSIVINTLRNSQEYSLTMRFFEDLLIRGKVTRDEKTTLKNAVNELFGEPRKYRWSKKAVLDELEMLIVNDQQDSGIEIDRLPF
jgi:predicted RNase H-like nuclease